MPTTPEEKLAGWVSISEVLGYFQEPTLVDWKVRTGAKEAKRISTVATKIGTRVHELIEQEFLGKQVKFTSKDPEDVKNCIEGYNKWKEDFGFVIEDMEQQVVDNDALVVGHYDIFGEKTLVDIKTSSRVNLKMWLQVNKYAQMRGGCDYVAILRLDKNLGIYQFEKRAVDQKCVELFDSLLKLYRYFNDPMGQGAPHVTSQSSTAQPTSRSTESLD